MPLDIATLLGATAALASVSAATGLILHKGARHALFKKPQESRLSDLLPFDTIHPDNCALILKDGSLAQVIGLQGLETSAQSSDEIGNIIAKRTVWLDQLAERGVSLTLITTRNLNAVNLEGSYDNPFLQEIHARWMKQFQTSFSNAHYIILTQRPAFSAALKIPRSSKGNKKSVASHALLQEISDLTLEHLHDYGAYVLDNGAGNHSPLLTFWASLINREQTRVRSYQQRLSEALSGHGVTFDLTGGRITYSQGHKRCYEAVLSLKEWGEESGAYILKDLLSLKGELILLHKLKGHKKMEAIATLAHRQRQAQMTFATDKTLDQFMDAIEAVQDQEASYYSYQLSIFVRAHSEHALDDLIKAIKQLLTHHGIVVCVEEGASEWLWRSQFPGFDEQVRSTHPLSSNIAHFISMDAEPQGSNGCDWGEGALRHFRTSSGSAYTLQLHISPEKEALAHSLVIAPAGSGKTTFFQHLIGGALRHQDLRAYIFDRFNGTRIFTQSVGGRYIDLSGCNTALNPLYCEDTPENRQFLFTFLMMLAGIKEDDANIQEELNRAIDLMLRLPKEQRLLNALIKSAFSVHSPLREGLKKWVFPSPFAHWFNGALLKEGGEEVAHDALDLDASRLVSFEMTDIQANPSLAAVMTTYIMRRIRQQARKVACPHLIFIDETAPMLEDPTFKNYLKTLLREHRKLRGSVNLCFQEPAAIEATGLRDVILDQCPTVFLFPNPACRAQDYHMFNLTESEWNYVKGASKITRTLKHTVLVKRFHESVILDLSLISLGDLLQLYRSGAEPLKRALSLQERWGAHWVNHYLERTHP